MKETDFSKRNALERYQRDLNSHIFGHNVHGLWQLILIHDMILTSYLRYVWNKSPPDRHHTSPWRLVITRNKVLRCSYACYQQYLNKFCYAYSKLSLRGNPTVMDNPMIRIADNYHYILVRYGIKFCWTLDMDTILLSQGRPHWWSRQLYFQKNCTRNASTSSLREILR